MNKRLHQSLSQYNKAKEDTLITISGTLGIPLGGQKLVEVPGRPGFVYVKLKDNTSEIIQAYNSTVSNTYDLPILVARSNNIYKVIGRNLDLYRDWGTIPYLPKHGGQHSFNPLLSMGADITWVYSQQMMPLLGYPSGTDGSPQISIAPQLIRDLSGNWKYVGNTGTISTTIYNPNTGSRAVMALVYIDTVSGNPFLLVNSGTYISDSLTGTNQVAPFIPRLTNPNHLPIAAVRLLSGTSTLTWNNLYDARPFLQVVPTGSTPLAPPVTGTFVLLNSGTMLGSVTTLNVGNGLTASITGSVGYIRSTGREILTSARTYYIRVDGSDSNNGLVNSAAGAFLTLQKAYDVIKSTLDTAGFAVTMQAGTGTYSAGLTIDQPWTGGGTLTLMGDESTPTNCTISATTCITITSLLPAVFTVTGFKLTGTNGFSHNGVGSLQYKNIAFDAMAAADVIAGATGATIECTGNVSITGNRQRHLLFSRNAVYILDPSTTMTHVNTPVYSVAFADFQQGGVGRIFTTTFTGLASGTKYSVTLNGVLNTGGQTLPGNPGGTTATGGQFA